MLGNWADFEPLQLCSNFDTEYVFFFFFFFFFFACLKMISVENWQHISPLQLCSNFDTEYVFFFFFFCICLKIISVENWQHISPLQLCSNFDTEYFKTSYTKYANFREIKSDMRRFLMAGYELSNLYNGLVFYQINGIVDGIFENNFKFTEKNPSISKRATKVWSVPKFHMKQNANIAVPRNETHIAWFNISALNLKMITRTERNVHLYPILSVIH